MIIKTKTFFPRAGNLARYSLVIPFVLSFSLSALAQKNTIQHKPAVIKSITNTSGSYNIKSYGAYGDGKHLDHLAINKTIDACAKMGGGTVYVPPGTYLCGSIHLKSNINLHLETGAVILGAGPELKAYDLAEAFPDSAYQDGGHTYFHNSLIWGEGLMNVSITGYGKIDGGGLTREDHEFEGNVTGGAIETGDKAIALKLCRNVLIRDITIFHGGHFAILLTGCDLSTLNNLTIDTNRDGIDIDCCTNTLVDQCRVNSPNDDAICPKSSYALNRPVITENLIISNCQVSGFVEGTLLNGKRIPAKAGWSNGRIKFGTESNGGFRNCVVSNCIFNSCNGLALEEVDGGVMENILISHIVMENITHYPIYITLGRRNRGPEASTKMGLARNITISDIMVLGADSLSGLQLTGSPGYPLENITLRNISVEYKGGGTKQQGLKVFPELERGYPEPFLLGSNPSYGLFARHVKGLTLSNIKFKTKNTDLRPALIANDIDGLEITGFKAPKTNEDKIYSFKDVKNITIESSPVLGNTK